MESYHSQYPASLPEYIIPSNENLKRDKSLYLPTCSLPSTGRPRKLRFVGDREKAVKRFKLRHKRKLLQASKKHSKKQYITNVKKFRVRKKTKASKRRKSSVKTPDRCRIF